MDWVIGFSENPTIKVLQQTFDKVLLNKEYIEVDEASEVLAAGEVLAAVKGRMSKDFPEELEEVLSQMILPSLVFQNIAAVESYDQRLFKWLGLKVRPHFSLPLLVLRKAKAGLTNNFS